MIQLIRSKRRTISLIIKDDGSLVVRAPNKVKIEYIEKFIAEKQIWIEKHRFKMQDFLKRKKSHKFINEQGILYLGKRIIPQDLNLEDENLVKYWYKKKAQEICVTKIDYLSKQYNLKYNKLKISNAKKRWGSCSSKNNINISWRVIMAPTLVVDYVLIHELAHIKQKNHSVKFWSEVEKMMKNYKKHDKWLEENRFLLDF